MNKTLVATHNAKFHADDVFAVATLEILLKEDKLNVARTRNPEVIEKADYVVDVGGVYDPDKNRFDHHQRGGAGKRENNIPYASFGLVWKTYGEEICGSKDVANFIDQKIVQPIDAGDNGVDTYQAIQEGLLPYTIQSVISAFRSTWKEEANYDEVFGAMVDLAKRILAREIVVAKVVIEAQNVVRTVYEFQDDKKIITFEKDHPFGRELISRTLEEFPEPIYAILYRPDHDQWQIVSINKNPSTMEMRKPLPEAFRGKKDKELQEATGISDAIFCHNSGFMATVGSRESAFKLAKKALDA